MMKHEWDLEDYELLHGDYGMLDSAASVMISEDSWLVTGGRVTFPYEYDILDILIIKNKLLTQNFQ